MVSRERIIEAAARVYSKHGFRGATTRLIAIEAGVNEVTLFRTFGSKGALLEAVLTEKDSQLDWPSLPLEPDDVEAELVAWVTDALSALRVLRPLLAHTTSEVEERPEAAKFACEGRHFAHDQVSAWVTALQHQGRADRNIDLRTSVVMFVSAMMGDVMGRPMIPDAYPPLEDAPTAYVRCFLRMIGAHDAAKLNTSHPAHR